MTRLTQEQASIIGAYTGFLTGDFSATYEYIEKVMGRPVFTHEMASKEFSEQLREKSKPDFLAICAEKFPLSGKEVTWVS